MPGFCRLRRRADGDLGAGERPPRRARLPGAYRKELEGVAALDAKDRQHVAAEPVDGQALLDFHEPRSVVLHEHLDILHLLVLVRTDIDLRAALGLLGGHVEELQRLRGQLVSLSSEAAQQRDEAVGTQAVLGLGEATLSSQTAAGVDEVLRALQERAHILRQRRRWWRPAAEGLEQLPTLRGTLHGWIPRQLLHDLDVNLVAKGGLVCSQLEHRVLLVTDVSGGLVAHAAHDVREVAQGLLDVDWLDHGKCILDTIGAPRQEVLRRRPVDGELVRLPQATEVAQVHRRITRVCFVHQARGEWRCPRPPRARRLACELRELPAEVVLDT
mmetsp:Transcript_49063/g.137362  ORF Transcript_49063/g.137362 Transcript_49063/m.137362 type:complete len:329 (-) Transcript_49063:1115-2101(-)